MQRNTILSWIFVSCLSLGTSVYAQDVSNVSPDFIQALTEKANAGDANAQGLLGFLYSEGKGVRQDYQQAKQWFEKAAQQGDSMAWVSLGFMYFQGQGERQDYKKAKELWEKAAQQGNAKAQMLLGLMYSEGKGIRQDTQKAKKWFKKSCDNGYSIGCHQYRKLNNKKD